MICEDHALHLANFLEVHLGEIEGWLFLFFLFLFFWAICIWRSIATILHSFLPSAARCHRTAITTSVWGHFLIHWFFVIFHYSKFTLNGLQIYTFLPRFHLEIGLSYHGKHFYDSVPVLVFSKGFLLQYLILSFIGSASTWNLSMGNLIRTAIL